MVVGVGEDFGLVVLGCSVIPVNYSGALWLGFSLGLYMYYAVSVTYEYGRYGYLCSSGYCQRQTGRVWSC